MGTTNLCAPRKMKMSDGPCANNNVRVAMLLTDDGCVDYVGGRFSPLGPRAHLPLIEVKISGPHGAGQYPRRALSACFLDFDHYRCRVDFRLCLSARCGNVIEPRPESINPNCSLQSKCLSRLPVSAAHGQLDHRDFLPILAPLRHAEGL